MDSLNKKMAVAFLLAVVVRMIFHYLTNFTYDDAYITFRYVENLIAGHGFVYNKGERVLGTTTPLFTLLLSDLTFIGIYITHAARLISLFAAGITAVILFRFGRSLRMTHFAFVPGLIFIFFPRLLVTDTGGMETALFSMFIIAGFYFQHKKYKYYALGMATLASVTRPEGFLLLFILLAYNCVQDSRNFWRYLVIPAVIIIPWLTFSYFYFGSPIPNSVYAKLALYSHFGSRPFIEKIIFIFGFHKLSGIVMFIMSLFGGYWLWKKQNFGKLEFIWLAATIAGLSLGQTHLFLWYVSPIYPVYFLLIGASIPFLFEQIEWLRQNCRRMVPVVAILLVVVLIAANYTNVKYFSKYQVTLDAVHHAIGDYLRVNADPDDVVAAEDIGYMGYYSGLKIIDRDGLVSPEVIPYNRDGKYLELILDYSPDWVVASKGGETSGFIDDKKFLTLYKLKKIYNVDFGSIYCVYSKIVQHKSLPSDNVTKDEIEE